jgi:hypothetical protein
MLKPKMTALAVALAMGVPAAAMANDNAELERIRTEIQQMKQNHEARIQSLEAKLQEAGVAATRAEETAQRAESAAVQASSRPAAANAFNPETSIILDGKYAERKDMDERHLTGFMPVAHEHGGSDRGFSLNHTELVMSANVDHWLRGQANIALLDDEIELEEAFFETLGLGYGLTVKGGRFRSGIGYQNEMHAHAWDFSDNSLMVDALFGEAHIQDGVQVKWVAPTDLLVELGGEAGRGAEINNYGNNGAGTVSLFAHVGGDFGASHAWRAGLSWLRAKAEAREFEGHDTADVELAGDFTGKSRIWIADFVYKWAPNGNAAYTNLKLQGEYFRRTEDGTLNCTAADGSGVSDCDTLGGSGAYDSRQSGWYLQGVWQFSPQWRAGLRYDRLNRGSADWQGADIGNVVESLADYDPRRATAMIDFNPSEFSRFRLQVARDESMPDLDETQWTLQYIMSLGAHGAHRF